MLKWIHTTIEDDKQAYAMVENFKSNMPEVGAFDTETTGLHIICDKPFLYQFGWYNENKGTGWTYVVDIEQRPNLAHEVIKAWHRLAKTLKKYLGHNVKFDMHMCTNIGLEYYENNLSDTMFYIRLATDNIHVKHGGAPLKLKEFATQYLTRNAKEHEKLLKLERSAIAKDLNNKLLQRLKIIKPPDGLKRWTKAYLDELFKDPLMDYTDLPEDVMQVYIAWLTQDVPEQIRKSITNLVTPEDIPYNLLNRKNVTYYGHLDIVWTLETYRLLAPILNVRQNQIGLKLEEDCILPLYDMERVGFNIDKEYLLNAKKNLKEYTLQRRQNLYDLVGQQFKIGQHELIKNLFKDTFNIEINSTAAEELSRLHSDLKRQGGHDTAVLFIEILQELRTLEKWYSTYICRFLNDLERSSRLYTQINQVGAVSGRVTSNFQQFPRNAIKTTDGKELFHPRRMVITTGEDWVGIVYLDYSQIELRLQALYTILVGHPDTNLCRAYMPYKCHIESKAFDYTDQWCVENAYTIPWYYDEEPDKEWHPLDVHGATAKIAFNVTEEHENFKAFRSVGKTLNFAKNYGAQKDKVSEMFPEYDEDTIMQIDGAYYKAFPGVKEYHTYCYNIARLQSYAENLLGVKYYNVSGHNLKNMLVQGSGAYFLKWKIRQLWEYRRKHNIKSRFQMNVHDELSYEQHIEDDPQIFFEFKKIMEDWKDSYVPIVADMELTRTSWADKQEVKGVEDLVYIRS